MAKTKKNTKKRRKNKANTSYPGTAKALLNFLLIIPEKSVNLIFLIYAKFMKPFSKAVTKSLRGSTDPQAVLKAIQRNIKKRKFKKEWAKSVTEIFNILIIPVLGKTITLFEVEGLNIIKALGKILGKGAFTIGQSIATGLEATISMVPGVGSVLDILMIAQGLLNAVATLTIQTLKIITKIIVSILSVAGYTIEPLVKIAPGMKNILGVLLSKSPSMRKRKTKRRRY